MASYIEMEVIKDTFEVRMTTRKLVANIKKLDKRITEIENKQANRFPHLIERLNDVERAILRLEKR